METPPLEDYQDAFARIERRLEEGSDLSRLGFWRLVDRVKLEPRLARHWAETVGRIDRKAFQRRRVRFPLWLGNAVLIVGTVVLAALVAVGLALAGGAEPRRPGLGGFLILVAGGGLAVTVHSPAHWIAGRLRGIRFEGYFLDGPFLIQPGVKVDYASYLRASPGARAAMHAAGAIATKVAPFAVFAVAYLRHRWEGYDLLPSWSLWAILVIGVVQIATDVIWSTRASDWKKVRRELRLSRIQRTGG